MEPSSAEPDSHLTREDGRGAPAEGDPSGAEHDAERAERERAAGLQLVVAEQPGEDPGGGDMDKEELSDLDEEDEADFILSCACCLL